MKMKMLGRGLGAVVTVLAVVGIPSMSAYADVTCYVSCSPPTTQIGGGNGGTRPPITKSSGSGSGSGSHTGTGSGSGGSGAQATNTGQATSSSGGSLPFTGADVEELTIGGVGALVVGGLLVRRGRSRRRAQI
jgi:hypothetical protein